MLELILLIAAVVVVFIARSYLHTRREQNLRDNFPERRIIEVTMAAGVDDARIRMARFWKTVVNHTSEDPKARKQGLGQIDFVYLATVPQPDALPVVSCLIYADPDKMDQIKRSLKSTFDNNIDVKEHETDPFEHLKGALSPKVGIEPEDMDISDV